MSSKVDLTYALWPCMLPSNNLDEWGLRMDVRDGDVRSTYRLWMMYAIIPVLGNNNNNTKK